MTKMRKFNKWDQQVFEFVGTPSFDTLFTGKQVAFLLCTSNKKGSCWSKFFWTLRSCYLTVIYICTLMKYAIPMRWIAIYSWIIIFTTPYSIKPEFRTISDAQVHGTNIPEELNRILFFTVKRYDLAWQAFPCPTKEIFNFFLIRVYYTNKTLKYGISIPNKLVKMQIDNWGISSIDSFLFISMSRYFCKIKFWCQQNSRDRL